MSGPDLLDRLAGLQTGSPVAALRAERGDIARHTEGAYAALLDPREAGGLTLPERAAVAAEAARHHADSALAGHYGALVQARGAPSGSRWDAIAAHVALVSTRPRDASAAALVRLREAGLGEREIVTLSQIVAFVSYQARVVAGLTLMERLDG